MRDVGRIVITSPISGTCSQCRNHTTCSQNFSQPRRLLCLRCTPGHNARSRPPNHAGQARSGTVLCRISSSERHLPDQGAPAVNAVLDGLFVLLLGLLLGRRVVHRRHVQLRQPAHGCHRRDRRVGQEKRAASLCCTASLEGAVVIDDSPLSKIASNLARHFEKGRGRRHKDGAPDRRTVGR